MWNDRNFSDIGRDNKGRGFRVRGIVFHSESGVGVGNDAADNSETADVKDKNTPESLLAGTGKRFSRVVLPVRLELR